MHVLFVPSWYGDAGRPLDGVFFRDLAQAVRRAGHEVGVTPVPRPRTLRQLAHGRRAADFRTRTTVLDDQGVATYVAATWNWAPAGRAPGMARRLALRAGRDLVRRYVAERGLPDVIHAHGTILGGILAVDRGQALGVPVVVTEHSSAFLRGLVRADERPLVRRALEDADAVLAVSRRLGDALADYAPGRAIEVLGNPVDTSFFVPALAAPAASPFRLVSVGFLRPVKGMDVLLDAFAAGLRGIDAGLVIAGDGPQRPALAARVRDLGLVSQVRLTGELSREAVRNLLQASHAFVLASRVETFGVALVEALSCGLPVVATRCGGPDDIVEPSQGVLVPPGDVDALAKACLGMRAGWSGYDRTQIRQRCVERFGEAAIVGRLDEVYRRVARPGADRGRPVGLG